jgi:hypothetical protein
MQHRLQNILTFDLIHIYCAVIFTHSVAEYRGAKCMADITGWKLKSIGWTWYTFSWRKIPHQTHLWGLLISTFLKYFVRQLSILHTLNAELSSWQFVAESRSSEAFVALCLLTVAGTSLLTQKLGFSDTVCPISKCLSKLDYAPSIFLFTNCYTSSYHLCS